MLAKYPAVGSELGSRVRPKRSKIVKLYTNPPSEATVVCVDELGPVSPRTFPPAPGWSPDGHRIKAPPEATKEDRASYHTGPYLPDRRQPKDPRQRLGKGVARRPSEDRARVHPQGGCVAQPHRGLVAYFPTTGLCRTVLCG